MIRALLPVFALCVVCGTACAQQSAPVSVVRAGNLGLSDGPGRTFGGGDDQFAFNGVADLRFRQANKESNGTYVSATRLTLDWLRSDRFQRPKFGARGQVLIEPESPISNSISRLRSSELYGLYYFRFAGLDLRARAGQFVLPFGIIAVYDTPLQPIQPLYEKSLGLRVDTGVGVDGTYGAYRFSASVTSARGPNKLRQPSSDNRLLAFRLSRSVPTMIGRFEVGGSLLSGKGPRTRFDTELPPSGTTNNVEFVNVTRFAGDGQYFFGPLTARGEFVFGADDENEVWGYFAEGNYALSGRLSAVAYSKAWRFPQQPARATTNGIGLNYDYGKGLTLRFLYEYTANYPQDTNMETQIVRRLTLQTRLNF